MKNVYIISTKRTPIGSFKGSLSNLTAIELGSIAIKSSLIQSNIHKNNIKEIYIGCVLNAGLGQGPARQLVIKSGLSINTPATIINKVCGSGMKALMIAKDSLSIHNDSIIISGGIESMSNAPYILKKARYGYRLGHNKILDHIMIDGLEDAYNQGISMGYLAENTAKKFNISREEQDQFAINSILKTYKAKNNNYTKKEIVPINITNNKGNSFLIEEDEIVPISHLKKIFKLKPVFKEKGTITAANSSSINDGAASIILAGEEALKKYKIKAIAKVVGHSSFAQESELFTTAPVQAITNLISQLNWKLEEIDAFEINEAFAVATIATIKELSINPAKVNKFGGACALGHPIGASSARIIVTLINVLLNTRGRKGIAASCIGGGEATAVALEIIY